jgi:hypothetical protein
VQFRNYEDKASQSRKTFTNISYLLRFMVKSSSGFVYIKTQDKPLLFYRPVPGETSLKEMNAQSKTQGQQNLFKIKQMLKRAQEAQNTKKTLLVPTSLQLETSSMYISLNVKTAFCSPQ